LLLLNLKTFCSPLLGTFNATKIIQIETEQDMPSPSEGSHGYDVGWHI